MEYLILSPDNSIIYTYLPTLQTPFSKGGHTPEFSINTLVFHSYYFSKIIADRIYISEKISQKQKRAWMQQKVSAVEYDSNWWYVCCQIWNHSTKLAGSATNYYCGNRYEVSECYSAAGYALLITHMLMHNVGQS